MLLVDESQGKPEKRSKTKLDDSLKTLQKKLNDTTKQEGNLNLVFANHGEEDKIYPLTIIEIAEAQKKDQQLQIYFKQKAEMPKKDISFQLIDDTKVLCKNSKLIIQHLYSTGQSVGITTTSNTLDTC